MMNNIPLYSSRLAIRAVSVVCLLTMLEAAPRHTYAQLSLQSLLDSSVKEVDASKYPDVRDAIVRFGNGDFNGAHELLIQSKQKDPQLAPAQMMLAQLFLLSNQGALARSSLEDAVKEHPEDPEAYLILGDLAYRDGRQASSELLFGRALELINGYDQNPHRKRSMQVRAFAGVSALAESREKWELAKIQLNEWIGVDPENANAHTRLGRALFHLQDYKGAYAAFQKVYEFDPQLPRPEISMALLYSAVDRMENAKKLMKLAGERAPDDLKTRLAVAQWYIEKGMLQEAKEHADEAWKQDENSLQAKILVGLVARFQNDHEAAETAFEAAHLQEPSNFAAVNQLALTLIDQPDEQKRRRATEYAQMNSLRHSNVQQAIGREATVTLAWVLFQLQRKPESVRAIQSALRAGGVSPESAFLAARILHDQGRPETARQLLEPLIERGSMFPNRDKAEQLLQQITGEFGP